MPSSLNRSAWSPGGTMLVAAFVAAPLVAVPLLMPGAGIELDHAARTAGVLAFTIILLSSAFFYLHFRLTSAHFSAWLTVGSIAWSFHGLTLSALAIVEPALSTKSTYFTGADLAVGIGLLVLVRVSEHHTLQIDPAALGVILGMVVAAAHLCLVMPSGVTPGSDLPPVFAGIASVGLLLTGVLVAVHLYRLDTLPRWCRGPIAFAVLAVFANRLLSNPPPPSGLLPDVLEILCAYVGAVVFCQTGLELVRGAIRDDRRAIATLHHRLMDVEEEARRDRERLHEVKGTIASIASASRLISVGSVATEQRPGLELMLAQESQRLDRMLRGDVQQDRLVELDPLLRTLVVGQRARGHDVHWVPSGLCLRAVPDQVTEILSILLDNAFRHGATSTCITTVTGPSGMAALSVADDGPGVEEHLRDMIFEYERRGPRSEGQGIGLSVARRLAAQNGGELTLDPPDRRGASFTLLLPVESRR